MQNRKYDLLLKLYEKEKDNYLTKKEFANAFIDFYWEAATNKKVKTIKFAKNVIKKYAKESKLSTIKNQYSQILHFERFEKFSSKISWDFGNPKKFDQSEFNQKLMNNLKKLESFDKDAQALLDYKHPIITLAVFEDLHQVYQDFSVKLGNISPIGMPKEFKASFKQQIGQIDQSIETKANEYKKYSYVTSMKKGIFNSYGSRLTKIHKLEKDFMFRYPAGQFLTPSNKIRGSK